MKDWAGLIFICVLAAGAVIGLRALARPRVSTAEEFERRASEEKTTLGSIVNALQDVTDPASVRSKEVVMQMKDGNFQQKKREGKANGEEEDL